ncbi:phage holin family protein [Allohahella marinimesophila]|uniref:Superfamily III holin-X n=1 Tax=Allohahella marinimesophila TaxID=1054972 RepID=A0ABP7P6U9_9GAMM
MTAVSDDTSTTESTRAARRDLFGEDRDRRATDEQAASDGTERKDYDYMRHLNPVDLVRTLSSDATALLVDEITLAKKEGLQAISDVKKSIIAVIVAGITLFAGTLFLMQSATYGLAETMPFWMSSLIVGGAVTLLGLILVFWAKSLSSAKNLKPSNTADTLKKDKNMLADHVS